MMTVSLPQGVYDESSVLTMLKMRSMIENGDVIYRML